MNRNDPKQPKEFYVRFRTVDVCVEHCEWPWFICQWCVHSISVLNAKHELFVLLPNALLALNPQCLAFTCNIRMWVHTNISLEIFDWKLSLYSQYCKLIEKFIWMFTLAIRFDLSISIGLDYSCATLTDRHVIHVIIRRIYSYKTHFHSFNYLISFTRS